MSEIRLKFLLVFNYSTGYSCQILMKILEKHSVFKFHGNIPMGTEFLHMDGRTDGHDKARSWVSQFCELS
jgi:hypothetical protein